MSSDIDENQIDRPTISLSNLEKSTQSKKNTSTIDRKPSQLGGRPNQKQPSRDTEKVAKILHSCVGCRFHLYFRI